MNPGFFDKKFLRKFLKIFRRAIFLKKFSREFFKKNFPEKKMKHTKFLDFVSVRYRVCLFP